VARDYGVYWPDWNANNRATFIIDKTGIVKTVERYGKGELPDPDKVLAEVKKLG
jgi:peroxiredoxin